MTNMAVDGGLTDHEEGKQSNKTKNIPRYNLRKFSGNKTSIYNLEVYSIC